MGAAPDGVRTTEVLSHELECRVNGAFGRARAARCEFRVVEHLMAAGVNPTLLGQRRRADFDPTALGRRGNSPEGN